MIRQGEKHDAEQHRRDSPQRNGDYAHGSEVYLEQSLRITQEIGDKAGEGVTLNNISHDLQGTGRLQHCSEVSGAEPDASGSEIGEQGRGRQQH